MAAACSYCEWPSCHAVAAKQTECNRTYCAEHYLSVQTNRQWMQDTFPGGVVNSNLNKS